LSADGGRSVGSRRTNQSFVGVLPAVRRRTDDAPSADKRQNKRRFAERLSALCRPSDGGQILTEMMFFHAERVVFLHTEITEIYRKGDYQAIKQ